MWSRSFGLQPSNVFVCVCDSVYRIRYLITYQTLYCSNVLRCNVMFSWVRMRNIERHVCVKWNWLPISYSLHIVLCIFIEYIVFRSQIQYIPVGKSTNECNALLFTDSQNTLKIYTCNLCEPEEKRGRKKNKPNFPFSCIAKMLFVNGSSFYVLLVRLPHFFYVVTFLLRKPPTAKKKYRFLKSERYSFSIFLNPKKNPFENHLLKLLL